MKDEKQSGLSAESIEFVFIIDGKIESAPYTISEILAMNEDKVFEDIDECHCNINESTPHCECGGNFEESKITGIQFAQQSNVTDVVLLVAKNMNIEIIDCRIREYWKESEMPEEDYINKSYIIGGDTIVLGKYHSKECRAISFFHEIGHLASYKIHGECSEYEFERIAWELGFMIAASHGIFFSEEAENFANENLETYKK